MLYDLTTQTLQELRAFWEQTRSSNFARYERYYGGDHPWENVVSKTMRGNDKPGEENEYWRFWKPANMAYVVVEEAVGYWAGAEVTAVVSAGGVRDREKSELLTAQLRALFYNQREDVARAQALYGEGILRVRTPGDKPGRLVAYGLSPYQAGPSCMTFCEDPDDPHRVTLYARRAREHCPDAVGRLNSTRGPSSIEFTYGQNFSMPDCTRLPGHVLYANS